MPTLVLTDHSFELCWTRNDYLYANKVLEKLFFRIFLKNGEQARSFNNVLYTDSWWTTRLGYSVKLILFDDTRHNVICPSEAEMSLLI